MKKQKVMAKSYVILIHFWHERQKGSFFQQKNNTASDSFRALSRVMEFDRKDGTLMTFLGRSLTFGPRADVKSDFSKRSIYKSDFSASAGLRNPRCLT